MKQAFKLNTVGSDISGNLLFCTFKIGKDTICKGFYNFIEERFHIARWNHQLIKENGITIKEAISALKEILLVDYDWILCEDIK